MRKNRFFAIIAVLVLTLSLFACSGDKKDGKEKETKIKTDVSAASIIDNIKSNAKVSDFKEKFDAGNIEYVYLNLDMSVVEDAAGIYINDQKVDEVTVIKASSGKASEVKKAFEQRVADQTEVSKQYDQAQYERLSNKNNYVIKVLGDYVILSISDDNNNVIKAFENSITE